MTEEFEEKLIFLAAEVLQNLQQMEKTASSREELFNFADNLYALLNHITLLKDHYGAYPQKSH